MSFKNFLIHIVVLFLFGFSDVSAQGTTCAGAVSLTVNAPTCTSGSISDNSLTTGINPACQGSSTAPTREGWYSYTAPGGVDIIIDATHSGNRDLILQVFSGACGSPTVIACENSDVGGGAGTESVTFTNQAAGVYYIRVLADGNNATTLNSICVSSGMNDNCANAVSLTPGATCTTTTGDLAGATQSMAACKGTNDDDVWYSFVATNTSHTVTVNPSTSLDAVVQTFSGSCASLTSLICDDGAGSNGDETETITGLTVGNTYYVRVYDYYSGVSTTTDFTICVTSPAPPPAAPSNNECANAVSLTPGASCTTTSGTVAGATQSMAGCYGTADDDVWYKFTATQTSHTFTVDPGTSMDAVVQVFSGSCASLSSLVCDDDGGSNTNETETVGGLTVGSTYYVRVYHYSSTATTTPTFTICITNPPPGPANDECSGAVTLTPGATCSPTAGTVTNSSSSGITGCLGTANDDVWYTFTAAATTQYITLSTTMDAVLEVFSGNCAGTLTSLDCSDPNNLTVTGLTVGTTYKVRVYSWSSSAPADGSFTICITNPPTCPAGLGTVVNIPSLPYTSTGRTTCGKGNEVTSVNAVICGSSYYYDGEDEVLTFTPTTSGQITITQSNTTGTVGIMLYNSCPFTGTCMGYSQGSTAPRSICVNVNAGTTYYLVVDSDPTPNCYTYDISITAPSTGTVTCNLNYTMASISHSTTNANYTGGTTVTLTDDYFDDTYAPIGFNFCFDGIIYTQCLISSNGYIIFNKVGCTTNLPTVTNGASPGGSSPYSFAYSIPNTASAPRNAILFTYQDVNPNTGGTIKYSTTGTAPNRVFIVAFDDVPYYSCTALKYKGLVKLYETSNIIEVHIDNKEVCSTWNGGNAILGLHNFDGTIAKVPAGRNGLDADWTTTNEAWRFTPSCATCTSPLPVTWLEFKAVSKDNYNEVNWSTASEINNSHFILEHSADGVNFSEVGRIEGHGNSNKVNNYSFNDKHPFSGVTYYRLIQYDFDGKGNMSEIISLRTVGKRSFDLVDVYPVPSGDHVTVSMNTFEYGKASVEVLEVTGRVMLKQSAELYKGNSNLKIDTNELPAGVYLVKVTFNGGDTQIRKIIRK